MDFKVCEAFSGQPHRPPETSGIALPTSYRSSVKPAQVSTLAVRAASRERCGSTAPNARGGVALKGVGTGVPRARNNAVRGEHG